MFVPLPNLDDRRWADLVDEGRALIPVLAPEWTDHNEHDPGITLMELFAWFAESQMYKANRITDAHRLAFLALVGAEPRGPRSAEAVVELTLKGGDPIHLPAGLELIASGAAGRAVAFRTGADVWVTPASLAAIQSEQSGSFRDLTAAWIAGKPLPLLGDDPNAASALYLGFSVLPAHAPIDLRVAFGGGRSGSDERRRIECERRAAAARCAPPRRCAGARAEVPRDHARGLRHHSAAIVWEVASGARGWAPLDSIDGTRAFTLDGGVRIGPIVRPEKRQVGKVVEPLYYVRARIGSGALDAPPSASRVLVNAVAVEQRRALEETWPIAAGVIVHGQPTPGRGAAMRVAFADTGDLRQLEFQDSGGPVVLVSSYEAPQPHRAGSIQVRARRLGTGTGAPNQSLSVYGTPAHDSLAIYTIEDGGWRPWRRLATLDRSGPADLDFTLVDGGTTVLFGDGRNGRVPPRGVVVVAIGDLTDGAAGNVASQKGIVVADTPWNRAQMGPRAADLGRVGPIVMRDAAAGGGDPETVAAAEARIAEERERPARAVTAADCEALARDTPGVTLARAAARPAHHPGYACFHAPGFTTLVVVPRLPAAQPQPSAGLLASVSSYVNRRRVIGTRIFVTGPQYVEVSVQAAVKLLAGQNRTRAIAAITAAVTRFLDPLDGGGDGSGWPLGRDVFRSEVLEAIDAVPGVDHVVSLALTVPGCEAQCGNVCLPPNALAASGAHRIEVL